MDRHLSLPLKNYRQHSQSLIEGKQNRSSSGVIIANLNWITVMPVLGQRRLRTSHAAKIQLAGFPQGPTV